MLKISIFYSFLMLVALQLHAGDVAGLWKTIDDKTGKARSVVEISRQAEGYRGHIVELINPKVPNPLCKECPGAKKGQPMRGLEILWGLKSEGKSDEWTGGEILDPSNGKTYRCRLRLLDNCEKLEVRGFIGFSLFGRSQTWHRVPSIESALEGSSEDEVATK